MVLPWLDVEIRGEKVSVFDGGPGHFYALDRSTGRVVSRPTHEAVVARLERSGSGRC